MMKTPMELVNAVVRILTTCAVLTLKKFASLHQTTYVVKRVTQTAKGSANQRTSLAVSMDL